MTAVDRRDDRAAIAALMTGFQHRDQERWDELRDLFHPDATMRILWFDGAATEFVAACERMSTGDVRSAHQIGQPLVRLDGDRALAETATVAVAQNTALALTCTTHIRFLDRVERRAGRWRIRRRVSSYDLSYLIGGGDVAPDHPVEYAALATFLTASGHAVSGTFPVRGGAQEREIQAADAHWLAG